MDYIYRKKKTYNQPLHAHKGSLGDFVDRVQTAGMEYGENLKTGKGKQYAGDLFTLASDPRMLYRAYSDLKGTAAGIDEVKVKDLGRYYVYVEWANVVGLPYTDRPKYSETVFPHADWRELLLFSLLLKPAHQYRLEGISFFGGRTSIPELEKMGALCDEGKAIRFASNYDGVNSVDFLVFKEERQAIVFLDKLRDLQAIPMAGTEPRILSELANSIKTLILHTPEIATFVRIRDKVSYFTPMKYLNGAVSPKKVLDWAACRWISAMLKKDGYPSSEETRKPARRLIS